MLPVKNRFLFLIILLCAVIFSVQTFAQINDTSQDEKSVVATGIGSIVENNIPLARDNAINEALRRSIEQTLGMLIESETLVKNFQVIDDNIMSKTKGYVKNYEVIRERKRDEYTYEVTVRATVKTADIESDLEAIATLLRRKNTPRMMVIIDEQNIGEVPGTYSYFNTDMNTAENTIMNDFMSKGFTFVDKTTVERNLDRQKAAAILQGNVAEAASFARAVGAEVIITGKAVAKATVVEAFGAKQRSQQATVSLKAIRSDTGHILGSSVANGAYPHIDDVVGGTKAIEKASHIVAKDLMKKILDQWQKDVSSGSIIVLNVRNVQTLSDLNRFKRYLQSGIRGVKSVNQRDWYNGFAVLEIVVPQTADKFAETIDGKIVSGATIKVTGITQNAVSLRLIK